MEGEKDMTLHCYNCGLEIESDGSDKDFMCSRCKCNRIIFVNNKPPLGLKPKRIHELHRAIDIVDAIIRYLESDKQVPIYWIEEYNELKSR